METQFLAFINYKQNEYESFSSIAEFAYNNEENTSTDNSSFKLNCGFYHWVFNKNDIDFYLKLKTVDKLAAKLEKLINVCQ